MDNILGQFLICNPFKRGTQRNQQISVFEILVSGNCSRNYFGFAFERVELQRAYGKAGIWNPEPETKPEPELKLRQG